jgi:hypothetical protein
MTRPVAQGKKADPWIARPPNPSSHFGDIGPELSALPELADESEALDQEPYQRGLL